MKRLFAVILACLICVTTAYAAEWGEGLGPDQPLPGVRKLDLTQEMGYSYTYPRKGNEANFFCDVLEIYLPREDLALGDGHAHLYNGEGEELEDIDFANPDQVELRPLEEEELTALRWGGGVCIEMHLPVSLEIGGDYYVLMDLNCYNGANGTVSNYDLVEPEQWKPVLLGDYGISNLYYYAAPVQEQPEDEDDIELLEDEEEEEEPEATEAPAEPEEIEPKLKPEVGDIVHFNVQLGGDAKTAVMFSENDSVTFNISELVGSGVVTGVVTRPDVDWGVVFLDATDEPINVIQPEWLDEE